MCVHVGVQVIHVDVIDRTTLKFFLGNMSSESGGSSQSGALGKSEGAPRAVILKVSDTGTQI